MALAPMPCRRSGWPCWCSFHTVSLGWLRLAVAPSLMPPQGGGFYLFDSLLALDGCLNHGHLVLPAGTLAYC